jgi:hypothetical protein
MQILIPNGWILFCVAFGVLLITSFIMSRLSRHFYTYDVLERKFSIMDLQWPSSPIELVNLVKGIYKLPLPKQQRTLSALKKHLYVDFIFMPAAYGSIFLLCMNISWKMTLAGPYLFAGLAWLQIVALVLDVIENIYLLRKIGPEIVEASPATHKAYGYLERFKWGIALLALICALSALLYFWLVGRYAEGSLKYALVIVAEIVLFFVAGTIAKKFIRVLNADTDDKAAEPSNHKYK